MLNTLDDSYPKCKNIVKKLGKEQTTTTMSKCSRCDSSSGSDSYPSVSMHELCILVSIKSLKTYSIQTVELKEFGTWQSKADSVFDLLDTFPDPDECSDCMHPPGEAAFADTPMYRTLEQAVLPKDRNDYVKDLWSNCLDSLFKQSCVSTI